MPDKNDEYYTPEEAAEKLGVTKRTITRNLKNEKLEGTKILGRWRIPKEVIDNMVK